MDEIFTPKEAAAKLKMDQVTLWRMRKAGKIACRKSGKWVRFTQSDLDAFLEITRVQKEAAESRRKRK